MENIQDLKIELNKKREKINELSNSVWKLTTELARIESILDNKEAELKELQIRFEMLMDEHKDKLKELEFYKTW